MADVAGPVSLAEQIQLVAGLRWRTLRNSFRKKNNVADLIGMGFVALFAAALVFGVSFAFYFAGYTFVSRGRLQWFALLFWVIFIFWQVIPVFGAGFGSGFEFRSLLRFPLSLRAFYLIGLAYGFADFASLAGTFWLLALTVGAGAADRAVLPATAIVVILFILLNVTIGRLVGSWLERLLARRRTRELFFGLFLLSMLSLQFISPLQSQFARHARPNFAAFVKYLAPFPPSLAGGIISGYVRRDFADGALAFAGLSAYTILFSALLWQRFSAQYRGEEISESAAPSPVRVKRSDRARAIAIVRDSQNAAAQSSNRFLGVLSPPVVAMLRKEYLYLTRNGFAFLLLILPPAQVLLFSSYFGGKSIFGGKGLSPEMVFPGMMAYIILVLMGPAYNAFAYESRGIHTYFIAPLKFEDVFLGKNLVSAAVMAIEALLCAMVLAWRIGLPSLAVAGATVSVLVFTVAGQLPLANWASLKFPRKLEFGSLHSQRNSGVAIWLMFGVQIMLGVITSSVLWAARWSGNPWLAAEAFAFLAIAAFAGYFASLPALASFAQKNKEDLIAALSR
jgi:ABC-2 type transport system permease protein